MSPAGNKETKIFKSGEYLFRENEKGEVLYILQTGQVRVFREEENKTFELGEYGRGSVIGEMALFDDKPRSASALAITDCRVIEIDREHFGNYLNKVPKWLSTIINIIIKRLRDTTRRRQSWQEPPITRTSRNQRG